MRESRNKKELRKLTGGRTRKRSVRSIKGNRKQGRRNAGKRADPRLQKMKQKGVFHRKTFLMSGTREVESQILSSMTRKQKKQWDRLSVKEKEKLLQNVEKKVQKKLEKSSMGAAVKYNPVNSTGKIQNTVRGRYIKQTIAKSAVVTGRDKNGTAVYPAVKTKQNTEIIRKNLQFAGKSSVSSSGKKPGADPTAVRDTKDRKKEASDLAKQRFLEKKQREGKKLGRYRYFSSFETEASYTKAFGLEMKRLSRKQQTEFKHEFTRYLNLMSKQAGEKEKSKKEMQKQRTFAEMQKNSLAFSIQEATAPIAAYGRWKVHQVMLQVMAALAGAISSVVSAVFPFIAVIAAVAGLLAFIAGFIGTTAATWDPATDGMPDPTYVTNTAVQWAEYIAGNDKHGYNDGFFSRWGPDDYSNVTFVVTAFDQAGLHLKKDGATQANKLYEACILDGFWDVTEEVKSQKDLKTGDLLIQLGGTGRIAIYCGKGKMVSAICDENGNQKHGQVGDQTGKEICIENYSNKGWKYVMRYYGDMTLYGGIGADLAEYAKSFVGKLPYVYGGTSLRTGADCSGFVQSVFAHFGYSLPRTAGNQYASGKKVGKNPDNWQPGDIVYYSTTGSVQTEGGTGEHIAIYIGNGKVVEESDPSTGCRISNWNYRSDCLGAARYLPTFDGASILTGKDNATKIWNYLRRTLGCSRAAAAGVMGNIYAECEFNPAAVQSNGVGHGIIQWSWDRWYGANGLQNFASWNNKNWSDLALQLAFFKHEIVEGNLIGSYYPGGWQKYKALTSVAGEGGSAHVFFYSVEYCSYISYGTFLSAEFEQNFACTSKRLAIANSVYNNRGTYP